MMINQTMIKPIHVQVSHSVILYFMNLKKKYDMFVAHITEGST